MNLERETNDCGRVCCAACDNASAVALGNTEKALAIQKEKRAAIVADLIAKERLPELFGLLGFISDCATQEKLLGDLPLLPWYPPNPSDGSIWREE